MSDREPEGEWVEARRSFTSRTPANENPDKVDYRRGFVTRHQVTGWRFVMRRIASGIACTTPGCSSTRWRTQSRAVLTGVLILITGLAGAFVFSLIRPNGQVVTTWCSPIVDLGVVCAGGRRSARGAQSDLSPADRRQTGQPDHGEKQ